MESEARCPTEILGLHIFYIAFLSELTVRQIDGIDGALSARVLQDAKHSVIGKVRAFHINKVFARGTRINGAGRQLETDSAIVGLVVPTHKAIVVCVIE